MLTRWTDFDRTFAALDDFRRRMDRVFDEYNRLWTEDRWLDAGTWPRTVLEDLGDKFQLRAEVPGMSDKDIQINLNQNVLTLSGERKVTVPEGYSVHRQERGSYRFSRSFTLPAPVDPEKASAVVKDGILTVTVEKAEEARPRQITVKAS